MASDDNSGGRPAGPVVLRIKLRYDDVATMVARFAPNAGKSGLFLPTKSIQPVGTEIKFELRLANDQPVLIGLGKVKHVRAPDPKNPKAAFGIAIELTRVSREGRELIIKMLERRRALGLPEVAIPVPDDVDAARRSELESQPRVDSSGIVSEAMKRDASATADRVLGSAPPSGPIGVAKSSTPITQDFPPNAKEVARLAKEAAAAKSAAKSAAAAKTAAAAKDAVAVGDEPAPTANAVGSESANDSGPAQPRSRTVTESGPMPVVKPERASAPLLTSPRLESGPIVYDPQKAHRVVPVLAPEPPKAKRPQVADLIARANEVSATPSVSGLDDQLDIDLDRAFARARALATGDLDAELAAVRESAAAPIEIGIEAASAELARQLGGAAISKRDREQWAPPRKIETRAGSVMSHRTPAAAFAAKTRAVTQSAPSSVIAAVTDAAVELRAEPEAAREPVPVAAPKPAPVERARPAIEPPAPAIEATAPAIEVETVPHHVALDPAPPEPEPQRTVTEPEPSYAAPSGAYQLLPSQPVYGDAVDPDNLDTPPQPISPLMVGDDVDPNAFDKRLDEAENTQRGVDPNAFAGHVYATVPDGLAEQLERQLDQQLAEAEAANADFAIALQPMPQPQYIVAPPAPVVDDDEEEIEEIEEIDDFDVIDEADEADAEEMLARPDDPPVSVPHAAPEQPYDFAANLDLGDEPSNPGSPPPGRPSNLHEPANEGYTFAEAYAASGKKFAAREQGEDFDEPHAYSRQSPPAPRPRPYEPDEPAQHYQAPEHLDDPAVPARGGGYARNASPSDDLENALAALDVDLDPQVVEQRKQRHQAPTSDHRVVSAEPRRLPGVAAPPGEPRPKQAPPTTAQRPLPGLPVERAADAPRRAPTGRLAHTVPRAKPPSQPPPPLPAAAIRKPPTQQNPIVPSRKPPTEQRPVAPPRKPPTQQVPVTAAAPKPKRAPTDDGVLIDFDDDE